MGSGRTKAALAAFFLSFSAHALDPAAVERLAFGDGDEKIEAIGALVAEGDPKAAELLRRFFALHVSMQDYLRAWHRSDTTMLTEGFASVVDVPYLSRLQDELDYPHDEASLRQTLEANLAWLERFADAIRALERTTPDAGDQRTVIPPVEAPELVRS